VSKESRRAARLARESRRVGGPGRPSTSGPTGAAGAPGVTGPGSTGTAVPRRTSAGGTTPRAGRRDRVRRTHEPTFLERYRTWIVGIAAIAVVGIVAAFVFLGAAAPAFACSSVLNPSPTPTVSPGSSERLGVVEDYMGASHQGGPPFTYTYCPPASGNHYSAQGLGPIVPRVYRPDDKVGPPNWLHNLEHGALVVLYKSDSPGASAAGQAAFKTFYDTFPPSPICKVPRGEISPVIAAFDQMAHPYAALVWGRVLYFDTWDPDLVLRFYAAESERLDANGVMVAPPEKVYCNPSPPPSGAESAPPSGASGAPSAATSAAPSTVASPAPSAAASPAPS
jgi:uncharacterized protein DUF3105